MFPVLQHRVAGSTRKRVNPARQASPGPDTAGASCTQIAPEPSVCLRLGHLRLGPLFSIGKWRIFRQKPYTLAWRVLNFWTEMLT